MRNIKFISIFAACGFVLSFVFGLFSHSSFLMILLKAVLFSIGFVVLGILISFIFKKFLLDSNSLGFESEEISNVQPKAASEPGKPGQVIDVVVEDEELPASESDNHFVVGSNAQMLKKTDVGVIESDNNRGEGRTADNGFVPMKGFESVSQSPAQNVKPSSVPETENNVISGAGAGSGNVEQVVSDDDLDTLPDMENLDLSEEEDSYDEGESYTESEYVPPADVHKKSGSSGPEIKDAALIAKAISTALSEEN